MYALELAGEDDAFAALEAASAATGVEVVGPGLAVASELDRAAARRLAYTRRASVLVGRASGLDGARAALDAAALDRTGTVAVRARDVRSSAAVDTLAAERILGSVLVDRGFAVDLDAPDHELRALFAGDVCLLGWLAVESVRGYGDRRPPDRPFVQPGSMAPLEARALVNVAGAGPGTWLLDPMCGTGGLLIEAGLVGATAVGLDAQRRMVRGTRENLRAFVGGTAGRDAAVDPAASDESEERADAPSTHVCRGDATALPLADGAVDAVVFDAPYGRQSKVAGHDRAGLVAGALSEARRVAARAVVVGDRPWRDAARAAGWTVETVHERRVHRSLVRHVHVLADAGRG